MKFTYHNVSEFCLRHEVEESFIDALFEYELITIEVENEQKYIRSDELTQLEKMVRLYRELGVNAEGIQVIQQLLHKIERHQHELQRLRNKLSRFEDF
jgi:chaperone modulatory protein CbpM